MNIQTATSLPSLVSAPPKKSEATAHPKIEPSIPQSLSPSSDQAAQTLAPLQTNPALSSLTQAQAPVLEKPEMTYVRGVDGKVYMVLDKEVDTPEILDKIPELEEKPPELTVEEKLIMKLREQQKAFNDIEVRQFRAYEAYNVVGNFPRR